MPAMNSESSWDFRDNQELAASHSYNKEGYIIEKGDFQYLELIKYDIEKAFFKFAGIAGKEVQKLENAHLSISHNPLLKGCPEGYDFNISDVRASLGAGFIYPLAGNIMTMPGLPSVPAANSIKLNSKGEIEGLF